MLLYVGLEGSLRLPYIYMAATARDLVYDSRLLQRVLVLDPCQLSAEMYPEEDYSTVVETLAIDDLNNSGWN